MALVPEIRDCAWANRGFHQRAARWIAARGVRQFIDIGSGLPTVGNTHDVVRSVDASCRVVYVDNDPLVRAQSARLLNGTTGVKVILGLRTDHHGARRPGRGHMHHPHRLGRTGVGVEVKPQRAGVELLGPVDVGHRDHHNFQLPVHDRVPSFAAPRWRSLPVGRNRGAGLDIHLTPSGATSRDRPRIRSGLLTNVGVAWSPRHFPSPPAPGFREQTVMILEMSGDKVGICLGACGEWVFGSCPVTGSQWGSE